MKQGSNGRKEGRRQGKEGGKKRTNITLYFFFVYASDDCMFALSMYMYI